ncbi:MAG: type II secretion system F family protein [Deltaproteobacteria bacterium]|nr:type II secretion system F family protein [Deltaproteobacteria bacterium]MBW2067854.1 type II secretion system F family protein [Deltaproteobacteria bacterium]
MPFFVYRAQDITGHIHKGIIEAASLDEAVKKLKDKRLYPVQVKATRKRRFRRVPEEAVIGFCGDLADLLRSGLPMDRSLALLAKQETHSLFRQVLNEIFREVQQGANLSDALQKHEDIFGPLIHHMVRAGEASGALDSILKQLNLYLERKRQFKQSLLSASIYPVLLLVMSLFSVIVLLTYVIPRFAQIFQDLHQELPTVTQLLLHLGAALDRYGWIIPIMLGVIFFGGRALYRSGKLKDRVDRILLTVPIISKLTMSTDLSRFFLAMGTMVNAGVPLLKAISLGFQVLTNWELKKHVQPLQGEVKAGRPLSGFFASDPLFPPRVGTMLKLAEEKGELGKTLIELGAYFESETEKILKRVITFLEPTIIIGTGLIIGSMVLSMFSAILGISDIKF